MPDLVGVGVQKAGTSSVADFLRASGMAMPPVAKAPQKELHWFKPSGRMSGIRGGLYPANFLTGRVRGEFTPNYIEHPLVLSQLADAAPHTKVVVFLRDPFARVVSAYNHARGIRKIPPEMTAAELLAKSWKGEGNGWISRAIRRSTYVSDLENLFRRFPENQVFVGFFEDWVKGASATSIHHELAQFAGLPTPDETGVRIGTVNSAEHQLSKAGLPPIEFDSESRLFLQEYFHQFRARLINLVGPVPW
jgi:hypothetical protein